MSGNEKKLKAAQLIIKHADLYKICECCESIILFSDIFCPLCEGYRFNDSLQDIEKLALVLAKKDKTDILPRNVI